MVGHPRLARVRRAGRRVGTAVQGHPGPADFLPRHYESIKAAELQQEAFPQDSTVGAIVVFDRKDGEQLTDDDTAQVEQVVQGLDGNLGKAFVSITASPPSENGLVQLAVVGLSDDATGFDTQSFDAVKKLRKDVDEAGTGDLQYAVTGNAAASYDQQESGNKALLIVGLATILLILVLLAIIFRSVLICLMPIVVVILVSQVAIGLIATANKLFELKASQDTRRSSSSSSSASAPTTSCSSSSATANGSARARRSGSRWPTRWSARARRSPPRAAR